MLAKIIQWLLRIKNYDKIPKLPGGMYASAYDHISPDESRVLAKFGARDPAGIKVMMRRKGVQTLEELVAILEIEQPKRHVLHRIWLGLGRLVGGYEYQPHAKELSIIPRNTRRKRQTKLIQARVKQVKEALKDG